MVSQLGTNAPNGTVGVHGWLRNAENVRYYPGVIMGFNPVFDGMSVYPAPDPYNVCQAVNANGDMDIIALNKPDTTKTAPLTPPALSGMSICYAIVVVRQSIFTTATTDGVGSISYTVVPGEAKLTGNEIPPDDQTIRNRISGGDTSYLCVIATVRVTYGDTSLGPDRLNASLKGKQSLVINQQIAPGLQCMSHERSNHAYLIGSKRSAGSNIWSYRQYSDGAIELYMEYVPGGSYDFDDGPVWHTAYIPKPPDYPLTLVYDGSVHGVTRSVSLEDSSNSRTGIAYTGTPHSVQEHQTSFGGIRITDRDQGSIVNPILGLSVNGWWY